MTSTTSDLALLGRKLGAKDYEPEVYVKEITHHCVGGHELHQQRSNIQVIINILSCSNGLRLLFICYMIKSNQNHILDIIRRYALATKEKCLSKLWAIH